TDMTDRKVILKMVMSLDGFATSPDGTHEWMFEWFGDDSSHWNRRALDAAGVHAMGRRSYEIMGPHWAASEGPIATSMNEKPKAARGEREPADQEEREAHPDVDRRNQPGQRTEASTTSGRDDTDGHQREDPHDGADGPCRNRGRNSDDGIDRDRGARKNTLQR